MNAKGTEALTFQVAPDLSKIGIKPMHISFSHLRCDLLVFLNGIYNSINVLKFFEKNIVSPDNTLIIRYLYEKNIKAKTYFGLLYLTSK